MPYLPSPGHLPPECEIHDADGHVVGLRAVHVRLRNGWDTKVAGQAPWPSRTTVWAAGRREYEFDVMEFEPQ